MNRSRKSALLLMALAVLLPTFIVLSVGTIKGQTPE